MKHDRSAIRTGMSLTGGICPVDIGPFLKREGISAGMFMTGAPTRVTKSAPPDGLAEIGARLDALRVKVAAVAALLRGRR